jgi:translation initiation factor IF-3
VNRRIRVPQVRVIGADGGQLGVLDTSEALRIAEEGGLDLVEVSPKAMPPVCKIMDYGKFKYEDSKKRKDAKKHQSTVTYKEIKFRPKTDVHDLQFKVDHIRRFLLEGNKARLVVIFRGREIVHPETGQAMLKKVVDLTSDIAQVEQPPMMEGRRMLMIIAPRVGGAKPLGSPTGMPTTQTFTVPPPPNAPRPMPQPGAAVTGVTAGAPISTRPPVSTTPRTFPNGTPRPPAPSTPRPPVGSSSAPRSPSSGPSSPSSGPRPTSSAPAKPANQPVVSVKPPAK